MKSKILKQFIRDLFEKRLCVFNTEQVIALPKLKISASWFNQSKKERNKLYSFASGFTLVEVLVAVSILSLLASIVFVNVNESRAQARDAAKVTEVKQLQTALELYKLGEGSFPGEAGTKYSEDDSGGGDYKQLIQDELVDKGYISAVPVSETGDSYTYINLGDSSPIGYIFSSSLERSESSGSSQCPAFEPRGGDGVITSAEFNDIGAGPKPLNWIVQGEDFANELSLNYNPDAPSSWSTLFSEYTPTSPAGGGFAPSGAGTGTTGAIGADSYTNNGDGTCKYWDGSTNTTINCDFEPMFEIAYLAATEGVCLGESYCGCDL